MSGGAGLFADLALARRLERTEGLSCARFVEARARIFPEYGATLIEVAGAWAMFDGVSSPLTQTFGLGMYQPATAADLEAIEAFFIQRGAPVFHEVSPLADAGLPALLSSRGYQPFEFSSVMYREIDLAGLKPCATGRPGVAQGFSPAVSAHRIGADEAEVYARVAAEGWAEFGVGDFLRETGKISASVQGLHLFLAELDGAPVAAGALNVVDGVALFAGASTIPAGRRQGAQLALLDQRLRFAAEQQCDVAMMVALPGSSSQRNAERNGFRIAYTRIKWRR
jgi:hypothetical protein